MSPAGGHTEKELDSSTIASPNAWGLFIAFLDRVGVDVTWAQQANVLIEADAAEGTVKVYGIARDDKGLPIPAGKTFKSRFEEYRFNRGRP